MSSNTKVYRGLGLSPKVDYETSESFTKLNYGKIIKPVDEDIDGVHARRLICVEGDTAVKFGQVTTGRKVKVINTRQGVPQPNIKEVLQELATGNYQAVKILVDDDHDGKHIAALMRIALDKYVQSTGSDIDINTVEITTDANY